MYQNTKSATTAGLLGIFLGAFGAHNWYLGEKGKGIAHVCMMAGGLLVEIVAGIVLPNVLSLSALFMAASILAVLGGVAGLAMSASGIWGLVEGITILVQGDAGLARKGYAVADPYANQPNYNQPGYAQPGYQNYNQPGYGMPGQNQGYGQPMPNQGFAPQNPGMMPQNNFPQNGFNQPMNGQPMGQPMNQPTNPQENNPENGAQNGQ